MEKRVLHAPLIELSEPSTDGELTGPLIDAAFRAAFEGERCPRAMSFGVGRRQSLALELGTEVAVLDPRETRELGGERWSRLCDAVDRADSLDDEEFGSLLYLLQRLSFDRLIIKLASGRVTMDWPSRYLEALARHVVLIETGAENTAQPFEALAEHAPRGSHARVSASYHLAQIEAKGRADLRIFGELCVRHEADVFSLRDEVSEVERLGVESRCSRVKAFYPMFREEFAEMKACMSRAEELASKIAPATRAEAIYKSDVIWPVDESWIKSCYQEGSPECAEEYAKRLLRRTPFSSRGRLHMAEWHLRFDRLQDAEPELWAAALYGPPATSDALAYLAQIADAQGRSAQAAFLANEAIRVEPDQAARAQIRALGLH